MNKIKLTLLALLLLPLMQVAAISDQDVIQTALTLHSQGLGEQEIAKELLRRGATIDQLQRISEQVGASHQSSGAQPVNVVAVSSDGSTRHNNGEVTTVVNANGSKSGVFGQDIFRTQNAFLPNANQPTPINYTLGAGDEVIIDYGDNNFLINIGILMGDYITKSIDGLPRDLWVSFQWMIFIFEQFAYRFL